MSDCAQPNGRWSRATWREPEHFDINEPKPTLPVRIEFDQGRPWEHPLALNGREVRAVYVGGVEHVPKRMCTLTLTRHLYPCNDYVCSECGKMHTAWRANEHCPRCGAKVSSVLDADGRELPYGR